MRTRRCRRGTHPAPIPSQLDVLSRWSDGSVKWVLVSVVVDALKANETFEFVLVPGRDDERGAKPSVSSLGSGWSIDYPRVAVRTNQLGLPQKVARKEGEASVELISGDVELMILGKTVEPSKVHVEDARLEEVGPVRTVVRTQGQFEIESDVTFGFISRVTIFANGQIDTSYTVINHQVKDFHGYGVSFPLPPSYTGTRFDGRELRFGGPADPAHGVRQIAVHCSDCSVRWRPDHADVCQNALSGRSQSTGLHGTRVLGDSRLLATLPIRG